MSLTLLLEKYDVSTEEGLQNALSEIEKEEEEVNEALSGALSRACDLEGKLRTASQAYTKLGEVKSDAQVAAEMVDKTAVLARDVSAKVRQLDLARTRVAEVQRRVHDLLDLAGMSAGAEAALRARDLPAAAAHVARFLAMDPRSVAAARARGAAHVPAAMARAADALGEHLVRKFEEAARAEDEAGVQHVYKLFAEIGRADEGVRLMAQYLAKQAEAAIRRAAVVSSASSEEAVFADALTRVLEAGAGALRRARGPALLLAALQAVQPQVCAGARRVYKELVTARRLEGAARRPPASPLGAEPALAELALLHRRARMYFHFLRRRAETETASLPEEQRQATLAEVERIVAACDLTRTSQDILAHYLGLERYFLEESINKALKLSAPQPGASSSSLVDDVFYIARKVIRRSISTGSVDGACAVLNEAGAQLEAAAGALRRRLRAPPPEPLVLPPPDPRAAPAPPGNDAARLLFIAHMNEAEAGAEWAERLATEAVADGEGIARSVGEREKLRECAGGLAAAAAAFRAAHELALEGVKAALKPRLAAWADFIADPGDNEEDECEEDDAAWLPAALDALGDSARAQLSPSAADALLAAAVDDIAARAQARLLVHDYTRTGGMAVERRARRLAAWAGGGAGGARERCARLTQAAALLAIDSPAHAPLALRPAARLPPAAARDLLARRVDFKLEDIKRLKL